MKYANKQKKNLESNKKEAITLADGEVEWETQFFTILIMGYARGT